MKLRCFAVIAAIWAMLAPTAVVCASVQTAIGKHLDSDGMEYSICTARAYRLAAERLENIFAEAVWKNELTDSQRRKLLSMLTLWRLGVELSGLESAGGVGCSGKEIDQYFIHQRRFLALAPEADGLINAMLGSNGIDPVKFCRVLPYGTELAIKIQLTPTALLDALGKCGRLDEMIAEYCPSTLPIFELAADLNGWWELIGFRCDGVLQWRLEVPDPNGRIFAIIGMIQTNPSLKSASRVVTDLDMRSESGISAGNGIVALKSGSKLVLFANHSAEKAYMALPRLEIPEKYGNLFSRMPQKAAAVIFLAPSPADEWMTKLGGLEFDTFFKLPALSALTRESDGLLYVQNSETSCLLDDLLTVLDISEFLKDVNFKNSDDSEKDEVAPKAVETGDDSPTAEKSSKCDCLDKLLMASDVLQQTPLTAGFYTVVRVDGKAVVSAVGKAEHQLVSFGAVKSEKTVPLVISRHSGDGFCALLSDGTIKRFELQEASSYRRMIGYLHTVYMYEEGVFGELIRIAAEFDEK